MFFLKSEKKRKIRILEHCFCLLDVCWSAEKLKKNNTACVDREFEGGSHVGFMSTPLLDSYSYNIVYRVGLFISVQYILPTVALVYLNTRVIVALRRSDTYRLSTARRRYPAPAVTTSPTTSHPPPPPPDVAVTSSSTRSITLVVAVIVSICIVVHVVALTAHVIDTVRVSTISQSINPGFLNWPK